MSKTDPLVSIQMSWICVKPGGSLLTKPVKVGFCSSWDSSIIFIFGPNTNWSNHPSSGRVLNKTIRHYLILEYFFSNLVKLHRHDIYCIKQLNFGQKRLLLEVVSASIFKVTKRHGNAGLIDVQDGSWDNDLKPIGSLFSSSYVESTQKFN